MLSLNSENVTIFTPLLAASQMCGDLNVGDDLTTKDGLSI